MVDEILVFDISGKFAHFRKFYTNVSSLTYFIPPKTTIAGLLASILEIGRNEYYEMFSDENFKISISVLSPLKKHMENINYMREKDKGGRKPTQYELLMSEKNHIKYRLFFWHKDKELMKKIKHKLKDEKTGFGTYLGQKQFLCNIKFVAHINKEIKHLSNFEGTIDTFSEVNNILGSPKKVEENEDLEYVRERIPTSFNNKREIKRLKDVLVEINKSKIKTEGKFKEGYQVKYQADEGKVIQNIAFV